MHRLRWSAIPALAALLALGALPACSPAEEQAGGHSLTVFGASSTRVVNEQLEDLYTRTFPGGELAFNNDGSSALVSQLNEGAPTDVLLTADRESMDRALADGTVTGEQLIAQNELVLVVPDGNPAGISSAAELASFDGNLVLCDPQVPCGRASARLAEHNDLELHPVSLEASVGDVVGKVASGEADAGWVYRTDARNAGDAVEVIEIPGAADHPNEVWAAAAAASEHPDEAGALVTLLTSEDMAVALAEAGFTPARQ